MDQENLNFIPQHEFEQKKTHVSVLIQSLTQKASSKTDYLQHPSPKDICQSLLDQIKDGSLILVNSTENSNEPYSFINTSVETNVVGTRAKRTQNRFLAISINPNISEQQAKLFLKAQPGRDLLQKIYQIDQESKNKQEVRVTLNSPEIQDIEQYRQHNCYNQETIDQLFKQISTAQ